MPTFADRLIERLAVWGGASGGGPLETSTTLETSPTLETSAADSFTDLQRLAVAIGTMFQPILELAEEFGSDGEASYIPAWGRPFEVQTANLEELRYLGNYVGVEIPQGATEAEARELVKRESGLERGTLASVEGAIRKLLGPGNMFQVQERTSTGGGAEPYHFNVLVGVGKSSTALKEVIESVKPAGLQFTILEVHDAWIEGAKRWSEVAAGLKWSTPPKEGEY